MDIINKLIDKIIVFILSKNTITKKAGRGKGVKQVKAKVKVKKRQKIWFVFYLCLCCLL
jgi:hypothetical protein